VEGVILEPDMGLTFQDLTVLRARVNVIVHSASSIALLKSLDQLVRPVIESTNRVARLALDCEQLECFVFVSSAYANAHLPPSTERVSSIEAPETVYQLLCTASGRVTTEELELEWQEVQKTGTSHAHRSHDFPWPYAYANHLTERLLTRKFTAFNKRLIILRPSIIEPAQNLPYRQICLPMSTPNIIFTAALALTPSRSVCFSSQFDD
jgi:fatty acyl-CoA reductase